MRPVKHILLAIKDPAAPPTAAINKAIQLASAFGASLELFHSITSQVYLGMDLGREDIEALRDDRLARQHARLDALAKRSREAGVSTVTSVVWDYPPHEAVMRQALKCKADLIVAERHQGRHIAPLLLHVTDWEMLRYSPVPVLLVKSRRPYAKPVILAAVDPTHANAKPTRLDDEILDAAASVERALKGELHVVHSFVPIPADVRPNELLAVDATRRLETRARAHARTRLEKALGKVKIARGRRHLASAHPINAIPTLARKIRSDIVVMGAISRTGLKRLLIGNTAERLIDDLPCDILVVKPRDFVTRVHRQSRGMRISAPAIPIPY
jgi:universal stress protein E